MAISYESICRRIYREIYDKLEKKNEEQYRFAPRGTIKLLFQRDGHQLLRYLFRSLVPAGQLVQNDVTISEDWFITLVEDRKLSNFWGTLVFATCSVDAALAALQGLVAAPTWPVLGIDTTKLGILPLKRTQLIDLFGDEVDADRFFSKQACFCPVVLRNREEVIVQDASCQRLPYLEETFLGEGSFGKVYRVKVAKNHFFDAYAEATNAYNGKPQDMARKDYIIADVSRAKEEYKIMKKILSANFQKRENNIVQSLGCLQIGSSYSLFMPVAICDLQKYMMRQHPVVLQELGSKANLVLAAAGLASGLHFLHSGIRTEELEELVCYHMDLNPNNVLVFVEHGRHVWKLSDFGMARVKMRQGQQSPMDNDFNSLFVQRKKPLDPSSQPTLNRRGEGTYLPPESISAAPVMRTGSDVWALGCVLSVVFAYLDGGASGVLAYSDARQNYRKADGYDRFFVRGTHFKTSKIHPEIRIWHEKISAEATRRNLEEGRAVARMLGFLQDSVLKVDQARRCDAEAVKQELENTYKILLAAEHNRRPSVMEAASHNLMHHHRPRIIPVTDNKPPPLARIASQRLASSDDFKGLAISPNANSLAYWTDDKIVLYTSESLTFTDGHAGGVPSVWNLPGDSGCFLQSLCLTTRYLVASTTGQNAFYIFNLEASQQVDSNLTSMHRIALDLPAITNIAMSPNSKTLVFVMRNESDARGPGKLVYANIPDLLAFITSELNYHSENSDSRSHNSVGLTRHHDIMRNSITLDWPAADIEHLSVSNDKDAYIVVRPELTLKTREHKIPIAHISTNTSSTPYVSKIDTLNVVSLGFDGSTLEGFFTTFCVVNDKNTCALVTRGKRFHLQSFDEDEGSFDSQRDIPNYRIAKLFNCNARGKLYAIGNISSKQQMMLLEVDFTSNLEIKELVKIPGLLQGDDVTAVAVQVGEKVRVIVASLTGASRRLIYRMTVLRSGHH